MHGKLKPLVLACGVLVVGVHMNYIHQLQAEVRASERELATLKAEIDGLRGYLLSSKFNCGNELNHLREAQTQALLARDCQAELVNAA